MAKPKPKPKPKPRTRPQPKGGAKSATGATRARPAGAPRRDRVREAAERRQRRNRLVGVGLVMVLVAAVVAALLLSDQADRRARQELTGGACTSDDEHDPERTLVGGNYHVPNPTFAVDPPAGGDHSARAASAGTYRGAGVPPDGEIVHAMEHGYVILWHRPALKDADRAALEDLHRRHNRETLLVERPSLEFPVAATAWHQRLLCGQVEIDSLEGFIDQYVDKGPEKGFIQR